MNGTLGLSQILAVFGTGILASLSPCVYPVLPITIGFLGNQTGKSSKKGVLLYALGQSLTFVLLGVTAVVAGETLGFSSELRSVNIGLGLTLILAGVISFKGKLPFPSRWNTLISIERPRGMAGAFLLGAGSALIASPCTSPILGGILGIMAGSGSLAKGVVLMGIYSLGFTFLFLVIGLGAVSFGKLPRSGKWLTHIHRLSSFLLVGAGLYFIIRGLH